LKQLICGWNVAYVSNMESKMAAFERALTALIVLSVVAAYEPRRFVDTERGQRAPNGAHLSLAHQPPPGEWRPFEPSDDAEAALLGPGCDFETAESLSPADARVLIAQGASRGPLLFRRGLAALDAFRNATARRNLLKQSGNTTVGVDFPGGESPPSIDWTQMKLSEYVEAHVDGIWTMETREAERRNQRFLFGPTDFCRTHKRRAGFIPDNRSCESPVKQMWLAEGIQALYTPVVGSCQDSANRCAFGLSGTYIGLYFHSHESLFNEVIHGKKLWLMYPAGSPIGHRLLDNADEKNRLASAASFIRNVLPELAAEERPLRCVAEAGDVVFVPKGWPHLTMNLGDTVFATASVVGRTGPKF
jgi:hypothetical protein